MVGRAVLVLVAFLATPAFAQADGGTSLELEEWGEPTAASNVRVYAGVRSQAGLDTSFDSPRGAPVAENVFDLRNNAVLGMDVRLSPNVRALAEARAFWRVTSQRAFDRAKGIIELEAGEAFVDVYTPSVDLRVGNQIVAFGSNLAFAPADQLNPRDQRQGAVLGDPNDVKLPNLGVRALGTAGKVTWTAAYFPFFRPSRYTVFGQDEAFVQPSLGISPPREVDESIEDALQPHLLETERPKAFPWLGELGLRATTDVGPVRLGASWIWVHEKVPQVAMDPALAAVASATVRGVQPDSAMVASVQERFLSGEQLYRGTYPRQDVFSAEAQVLVRSAQVDLDLAYTPAQTLYTADLLPVRKAVATWVLGVTQAADSPLLYNVTYLGFVVPELSSEDFLFLLEPATAAGAPRTVSFHALFATAGYRLLDGRVEVSVRGAVEPIQWSWMVAPQVAWRPTDRITLALGAELYQGKVYSPFGYYGHNDQVVARFGMDVF